MAAIVLNRTTKLDSTIRETLGDDLVFTNEQNAHKFVIQCTLNNSHINLTGTVTAQFMCPDNATVPINGTIENGKAVVTLPAECYEVPGRYRLSIFNTQGGATVCIYTGVGTVRRTSTGKVVDRGIIPNLNELQQAAQNIAGVENIDITQTKSGNVITVTTTNRNNVQTNKTITEPTATMSKAENGDYTITVTDANGSTSYTIEDTETAVRKKATIEAVSRVKTAIGNPLTITDGMDAPAVKTVVTLEPKQDLHGYDHPWVGGSGKNLFSNFAPYTTVSNDLTYTFDGTDRVVVRGTASGTNADSGNMVIRIGNDAAPIHINAGETFTLSLSGQPTTPTFRVLLKNNEAGTIFFSDSNNCTWTFTAESDMDIDAIMFRGRTAGATYNIDAHLQIEIGNTATSYEPYSNICPIEGYDTVRVTATGKNLMNISGMELKVYTSYTATPNRAIVETGKQRKGTKITVNASSEFLQTYNYGFEQCLTPFPSSNLIDDHGWQSDSTETYTMQDDVYTIFYVKRKDNGNIDLDHLKSQKVMVSFGENPEAYEPYQASSNTTSLSVAQAAGATVYGGTVTLNEDGSGTLVVDKQYLKGSECTWSVNTNYANTFNGQHTYGLSVPSDTTGYSSAYVMYDSGKVAKYDYGFAHANAGRTLYVKDKDYSDLASFQTHIADVEFVYNLATPSNPIQLTADQLRTLTGKNHVWTDGTKLELTYRADKYADVEKFLNAIPTGTKTGDPAVFADGADDLPFEKLTIAVEPHQEGSGDPSPDNVRPIIGWDEVKVTRRGKNLLGGFTDYTVYGITIKDTANGISIRGTFASNQTQFSYTLLNKVLPAGAYVVNGVAGAGGSSYQLVITGGGMSATKYGATNNTTFTSDGTTAVMVRLFVYSGNSPYNVVIPWQIEIGSTPTAYEPYTLTTLPISLKYATGSTVYGGTVTINRDGTGSVVVDRAYLSMSGFQYESGATRFWYANVPTPYGATVSRTGSFVCDKYIAVTDGRAISGVTTGMCYFGAQKSNGNCDFYVHDTRYTDATTFNAAVGPVSIAYKLATPTTYTLTVPQLTSLLGNNTVWCDAGQVTVKYKRDIGKMISNLYAMLVDTGAIVIENEEDATVEGPGYP